MSNSVLEMKQSAQAIHQQLGMLAYGVIAIVVRGNSSKATNLESPDLFWQCNAISSVMGATP